MNLRNVKTTFRGRGFLPFVAFGVLSTFAVFSGGMAGAQAATVDDVVASPGCAMGHCNQGLTDNTGLSAPWSGEVVDGWHDTTVNGSLVGIGCVGAEVLIGGQPEQRAVCTFRASSSKPTDIRAYDIGGEELWSSTALSSVAYYSAPIIGPEGDVIAADESRIIRFGPSGETVWSRPTAGGNPISPNVTDDGHIILATQRGPVSAYDFETGNLIAQLRLDATIRLGWRRYSGYFDTVNTPAIKGNRIYISTQFRSGSIPLRYGRLYALDLEQNNGAYSLVVKWYYEFRAPSGTSPTLGSDEFGNTIIYFDGSGVTTSSGTPVAMAVRDLGNAGERLWSYGMSPLPQSSPALDPRGGIWYFAFGSSQLVRLVDGKAEQTINVNDIVEDTTSTFRPFSVMTISRDTGPGEHPVMIVAATSSDNSITYVIAIDLVESSLLWQYRIDEGRGFYGGASGQYSVLINQDGEPVLVFSTRQNGVWGLVIGDEEPTPVLQEFEF